MMATREESKKRRKQILLDNAKEHKSKLSSDLNESSERVLIFGKNALAISGVLYVGFTIIDKYLDSKLGSTEKKKNPNRYDTLNKIILPVLIFALQQGSMTLIRKARLMLMDYIEKERNVSK